VESFSSHPEIDPQKWQVTTFGDFKISPRPPKFRTRKTEALVTLLALRPGTYFSRDTIATLFWPEDRQDTARQSVRMAISNIRTALGKTALLTDRDSIALNPAEVHSDLSEFEHLVNLARTSPKNQLQYRTRAFEIANKPWLPSLDTDWVHAESPRIQELIVENSLALIHLLKSSNQSAQAIHVAKQTLERVGCREDIHIALMQLYVDEGLTSLAIAQFEILENQLDDLWGEPPSPAAIAVIESAPKSQKSIDTSPKPKLSIPGLIGRETEVLQIVDAITAAENGINLTLIGTGGTGKTTLARAAATLLNNKSIKTHFIDLTTTTNKNAAAEKILTDLNISSIENKEAISAIARSLKSTEDVYILDNLEQLGPDATELIEDLKSRAPNLRLILTTRSPINLSSEKTILVKPLTFPQSGSSLESIRAASAIQLFEQQAIQSNPDFAITTQNAKSVVELCRRLDGLPLPIKLAAARIIVRTPAQILASIHTSLEPIRSTTTQDSPRHSNIRSTVEWSYQILTPQAQSAALTLSLFAGRFTEDDAKILLPNSDYLAVLEELVKSSLLNNDTSQEKSEFWFYETVRASLADILGTGNAHDEAMNRLLDFCIQKTQAIDSQTDLPGWKKLRRHFVNIENILNCLNHASNQSTINPEAAKLAIRAQKILTYFESQALTPVLEKFFQTPDKTINPSLRAQIGCAIMYNIANTGDVERQSEVLEQSLKFAANDEQTLVEVRHCLANSYKVTGEYEKAIAELDWVLARTDPNDHQTMGNRLYRQGLNYGCLNDRVQCFKYFKEALPHARKAQDINNIIRLLFDLGSEYANLKDANKAIESFSEAEALSESVGSLKLEGLTRWQHGDALLDLQKPAEALEMLQRSIKLVYEGNFPAAEKWIFIKAAQAATRCGHPQIATKLLAKGKHVRDEEKRALAVYETNYLNDATEAIKKLIPNSEFQKLSFDGIHSDWQTLWDEFDKITPI